MQRKLLGIINVDLDATGPILITPSAFVKILRRNRTNMKQFISCLWTLRKLLIHLGGSSCKIFSLSLYSHKTGEVHKNVSE
jgi:hypothetical protein